MMVPTFIGASNLMKGDTFVRAYDGVNGKPSTLALIEVIEVGERAGGFVSLVGIRTVPENSESSANVKTPARSYLVPENMMVLVLFHELIHVPSQLIETTHRVLLKKGVYLGPRKGSKRDGDFTRVPIRKAMHFTRTEARSLALIHDGIATPIEKK